LLAHTQWQQQQSPYTSSVSAETQLPSLSPPNGNLGTSGTPSFNFDSSLFSSFGGSAAFGSAAGGSAGLASGSLIVNLI
jgi:hypothetical protein